MKQLGIGLDVVSIQELKMGLKAGFAPEDILYTPNCVSYSEVQEAVKLGAVINIDNISILEQFGNEFRGKVPVCLRINPHILAGGNYKISTGHIDSKFGISIHQMPHVRRLVTALGIKVVGMHMHSGSDILNSDTFLYAAEVLFNATEGFEDLEFLDMGSGFKVAYKQDDVVTDLDELGDKISTAFEEFCEKYGRPLALWFEPGKFLVSEAGNFLARVNVVKPTPSATFIGLNSGLNHLLRPMMYNAYHHIINLSNPKGPWRVYNVVGYICETDTFGYDRKINEVREGDLLCINNAGAYGFSMSSNYNSRLRPAEVLIYKGKPHLIRKREEFDDLLRNQVDIFADETVAAEAVES
jgi:diaminopimelate decarboxylase